ncbi:hypothetical protein U9M49_21110 [Cytobacillus sp. OWB-43]|uniref:hypothetical protein n=1 Tax=Cytobacillus sp. OWB-43 TaxID=3108468 RepID=UPI002AFEF6D4|nr:hypothetical protein [Cytobacillus sp. OWB-43]MEA1855565.1 hypothetical protein [Cytobacillus sp. OWB-43]
MKTETMSIGEFLSGDYKKKEYNRKNSKIINKVGTSITIPLILAKPVFAATPTAIPVGTTEYLGEKSLEILAHALDPLVDLMVALSFPISSVVVIGSCFFFMLGKSDRAWTGIQNGALGYVLIQIMPMLLKVLKEVGSAI